MKKIIPLLITSSILILNLTSCDWVKDKSKKTINKAGEVVGKVGSEFGDGVYKGVKKTFDNEVVISEQLKRKGIEIGEVIINSTDSTSDNILTTYIIFNKNFEEDITIKIFKENGKEYGRLKQNLKGEKGIGKYVDFVFDRQVNIGTKGNITFE